MKTVLRGLAIYLVFFVSANCFAYDGNDLLKGLESENDFEKGFACGYTFSVGRTLTELDFIYQSKYFCLPSGVTVGQTTKVVEKYLKKYPEELHMDATVLIYKSLNKYFPCREE